MIDKSLWPSIAEMEKRKEDEAVLAKIVPRYDIVPPEPPPGNELLSSKAQLVPFKYKEDEIVKELHNYLASTYSGHYVGEDNIQSVDLIFAAGHGRGFSIGNIIKYAARQGKKQGQERAD